MAETMEDVRSLRTTFVGLYSVFESLRTLAAGIYL